MAPVAQRVNLRGTLSSTVIEMGLRTSGFRRRDRVSLGGPKKCRIYLHEARDKASA